MHRFILPTAVAALASHALAGIIETRADAGVLQFVDGDWEDKCEGEVFPIKWSAGNGKTVAVTVKGQGWEDEICGDEIAPGGLEWTVEVPKCDAEYSVWLKQENCEELESPKFMVNCAGDEPSGPAHPSGNWSHIPEKPSVTVVWQDEECSCEKTKVTVAPTPSKNIWFDNELSCSVTATSVPACDGPHCGGAPVAPAATSAAPAAPTWNKPAAPAAPTGDKPVAPAAATSAAVTPVAPAAAHPVAPIQSYTGAASKLGGSALALVAVFAAALAF